MIPRRSIKRKYRPSIESLERKQLLSAGTPTLGSVAFATPTTSESSHAEFVTICPCGTGKGIRIVTPPTTSVSSHAEMAPICPCGTGKGIRIVTP
jgi:hypothetical protein